jgi:hypothetical protein
MRHIVYTRTSFEPFGFIDWFSFNNSLVDIDPILFDEFSIFFAVVVELFEFEIVISVVLFPLHWDFSSSPEHSSLDDEVSLFTIDTQYTESIFSEVL